MAVDVGDDQLAEGLGRVEPAGRAEDQLPLPLVERLLGAAMSRGAEFGEVYVERATTTAVSLTEGLGANSGDPLTTLNESAIFGGVQKRVNAKEFRGGQLQSLFGGIEIDLRDADMAENQAVLHANAVFGGIELRVPETWYVAARGQGIFGGYTDSTRYTEPVGTDKPKKTLIVMGTAIFGGVEIRN